MSIGEELSRVYPPLGVGEGLEDTDKLFRFRLWDGTVCVAEAQYPNVWLRFLDYSRNKPNFVSVETEKRIPEADGGGFHSNVLSTRGFEGRTMMLFRTTSGAARSELKAYLQSFR